MQLARTSSKEPTEREFEVGMEAANRIKRRCVLQLAVLAVAV